MERATKTTAGLLLFVAAACGGAPAVGIPAGAVAFEARPRPERCVEARPESLKAALAQAGPGSALCLSPGSYLGPWEVPAQVTVFGPREAVLKTSGQGTTVRLSSGAALVGVTVDGSGGRFDVLDAAVHVEGEATAVEGVKVLNAVFGILSEKAKKVRIVGNHVVGTGGAALGMRGDGIRLWETHDSLVEHNRVEASRDLVVWYSNGNRLVDNVSTGGRYGTHFMYSHRNVVERGHYGSNEVGIFVMYSRDIQIRDTDLVNCQGAAGMGLGLKESGNVRVTGTRLVGNTLGVFVDNSPLEPSDENRFEGNELRLSEVGIAFLGRSKGNVFSGNAFRDNYTQVRVDSGGDALDARWEGNHFDDYRGYDLDGDGKGDLPYELRDLASNLTAQHPALAFLRGTPALAMVSVAGEVVPLFAPKPVLRDEAPRTLPIEVRRAH